MRLIATSIVITACGLYTCSPSYAQYDSVWVAASDSYDKNSGLYKLLMGGNYRREWSTPVKMPVFDIRKVNRGMRPLKLGGGMQTKSLRLADATGKKWVLRTVDKNVEKLFPEALRNSPAQRMMQDMVSASHPYGALIVAELAKTLGITSAAPQLFYVPDDTAFGEYRNVFSGKICFLEERNPLTHGSVDDYEDIEAKMKKDNSYVVLKREFLKARLLDMLVADWDRHEGQYRFVTIDSAGKKWVYPIPVDRDQAFFNSGGVMAGFAKAFTPFLKGYHNRPGNLKKLNYKARAFDMKMMSGLTEADWSKGIAELQTKLTDDIIHYAVTQLPPEIYAINGKEIAETLIHRRDAFRTHALAYYSFLNRKK